jgi:hypothetical protein
MFSTWGAYAAEVEPTPPVQTGGGVSVAATSAKHRSELLPSVTPSTHASPSSAHASVQLWPPSPLIHVWSSVSVGHAGGGGGAGGGEGDGGGGGGGGGGVVHAQKRWVLGPDIVLQGHGASPVPLW